MSSGLKINKFSVFKTTLTRQILNTLDFLFTDNQISESMVVSISKDTLSLISSTTDIDQLFYGLNQLTHRYPIIKPNLQKTLTALTKSYAN